MKAYKTSTGRLTPFALAQGYKEMKWRDDTSLELWGNSTTGYFVTGIFQRQQVNNSTRSLKQARIIFDSYTLDGLTQLTGRPIRNSRPA